MVRFLLGPDVALRLAEQRAAVAPRTRLLAPTLLRSQVLARLYQAVRHGTLAREDADRQLDYIRGLRIRLLGDRVLQRVAWRIADHLGWPDTYAAEYVALTELQADAFVTVDPTFAREVAGLVSFVSVDDLIQKRV